MIQYYQIEENGITEGNKDHYNWLVLTSDTEKKTQEICRKYHLPADVFVDTDFSEGVTKVEKLEKTRLSNPLSIVLLHLKRQESFKENRIEPLSFILSDELMITYLAKDSPVIDELISSLETSVYSFEKLLTNFIFLSYQQFITSARQLEKDIEQINKEAQKTTENQTLVHLSETEQTLILLYHALHDQEESLNVLWHDKKFRDKINDPALIYDTQQAQKQALKLVNVYRDMILSISSLFNSLIDNNLNHIMEYLETLGLLLSVPALIGSIWGMNTGVPGEKNHLAFWLVLGIALIFTILLAFFLQRKNITNKKDLRTNKRKALQYYFSLQ